MEDNPGHPAGAMEFTLRRDFERYCQERMDELRQVVAQLCRRNAQLADDVLQETLFAAGKVWDSVGLYDNPMKWLVRTARNQARDAARRTWRDSRRTCSLDALDLEPYVDAGTDAEAWHDLKCMVAVLPERQAQVILLKYDGWTVRDIGLHLGIEPTTVRGHLSEARRRLRGMLADERTMSEAS